MQAKTVVVLLLTLIVCVANIEASRAHAKSHGNFSLKNLVNKVFVQPINWIVPKLKMRMPRYVDLKRINATNCIRFGKVASLISALRQKNAGWEAAHNDYSCWAKEDLPHLAGLDMSPPKGAKSYHAHGGAVHVLSDAEQAAIPASFDAAVKWPGCMAEIRNQLQCGSCWAFSGASAMADRICIKTNGKVKPVLSPQQLVSCSQNGGCNGGQMNTFWTFAQNTGVQEESCYPYVSGNFDLPACSAKCSAGQSFGVPFKVNPPTKGYAGHMLVPYKPADWRTNVPLIQYEIMTNGPVQAAFNVPREFMNYKSGVYKCMNCTDTIGGHAIKLTGWGVAADGTKYWIMANSWGSRWGENGYAKFAMGQMGIENSAYGAIPTIASDATTTAGPATPKPLTQAEIDQLTSASIFNKLKAWFATQSKTLTEHAGAKALVQRQSDLIAAGKEEGSNGWTKVTANWQTPRWNTLVNVHKVKGGFESNGWRSGDATTEEYAKAVFDTLIKIPNVTKYTGVGIGISTDKYETSYYIVEFVQ